jgi:hypothetical protein
LTIIFWVGILHAFNSYQAVDQKPRSLGKQDGVMAIIGSLPLVAVGGFVVYTVYLVIARLYWSPLAKFPGPKLAAVSNWYEFYYDVILQGRFTGHIQSLHQQYGGSSRLLALWSQN